MQHRGLTALPILALALAACTDTPATTDTTETTSASGTGTGTGTGSGSATDATSDGPTSQPTTDVPTTNPSDTTDPTATTTTDPTATTGAADDDTIYEVQMGQFSVDDVVHIKGVIVTSPVKLKDAKGTMFVEEPEGGEYSGIAVYMYDEVTAALDAPPGSIVDITATYSEFYDNSQLVVMNVGRVPYKVPERMPIGLAIGLGATWITGNTAILERSALKFVIYPELVPSRALFNTGSLTIDGQEQALELATNLDAEIVREYEALKPKIIGAAISRLIVRAAVAEGARAAGNQAKDGAGAIVGLLAALAAEGAMVAADKPDTRSWTLLPAFVFVARVPVSPGAHQVRVTASGSGARETHDFNIDVKPGGFAVVDVTTLR